MIGLRAGGEDAAGWGCFWADDRATPDASGQCLLLDNQFALIPVQFASAYFGISSEVPKYQHFSIPQFDEDGEFAYNKCIRIVACLML